MTKEQEYELLKAAEYLGISHTKMWRMAKEKEIPYRINPLDRRKKLFRKTDLDALKRGEIPTKENGR